MVRDTVREAVKIQKKKNKHNTIDNEQRALQTNGVNSIYL